MLHPELKAVVDHIVSKHPQLSAETTCNSARFSDGEETDILIYRSRFGEFHTVLQGSVDENLGNDPISVYQTLCRQGYFNVLAPLIEVDEGGDSHKDDDPCPRCRVGTLQCDIAWYYNHTSCDEWTIPEHVLLEAGTEVHWEEVSGEFPQEGWYNEMIPMPIPNEHVMESLTSKLQQILPELDWSEEEENIYYGYASFGHFVVALNKDNKWRCEFFLENKNESEWVHDNYSTELDAKRACWHYWCKRLSEEGVL